MYLDPTADLAVARPAPPDDDAPAALLLAGVVELARRDAAKGCAEARAWLAEWVDAPAGELLARGRVRVAA